MEVAGPAEAGGSGKGLSWEQVDSSGNLLAVGFQTCARVSQVSVIALGQHFDVCAACTIFRVASWKTDGRQVPVTVHGSQVQDISVYFTLAGS